ncbi:MAG: glycosyltransferase [Chloroflexota bacterium]|nr:glycosyltransferase [Chloroflexota bacterium]
MRILFSTQPSSGHWHPLVPLARALQLAGHEVAFASTPGFCPVIEAKGFRCFRAGIDDSEEELRQRRKQRAAQSRAEQLEYMQAHVFAGKRAERSLPEMIDILHEWRPNVAVRESAEYASCVAAERAGIPHATVPVSVPQANYLQLLDAPLKHLCDIAGLSPREPADLLYHYLWLSSRPLSLWNPEFAVPPTMHTFRYAGFNQSGEEELPDWVADLQEQPTVYVTLGTVFNHRTDIFSAILAGLQEEPINLIVTVGRNRDPQEFGAQPAHVHVERYIPQDLLLPLCNLVITHGGSGTMMDALSHALPMVMVPLSADQPANAQRCAELGVARVIEPEACTAEAIQDATREVLRDPQYRQASQRLQDEIRQLPGLEYPVALLEKLAAEHGLLV